MKKSKDLVSIIMPAYNSEDFIEETIESVIKQTYQKWELLIVDDSSTDRTVEIIKDYIKLDDRITLEILENNSGAAIARNRAVENAKGKYLAFLDSDDLWDENKLSKQIEFMEENGYLFTSTSFGEMNDESEQLENVTYSHTKLDYDGVLKYCPGNSTVMYNASKLGKFYSPNIRKRNDFAMWLQVIKKAKYLYGLPDVLSIYRVRDGSLSKDKVDLVKYQWEVYRNIENLSFINSLYLLIHKIISVLKK